jgi:hypothetical protein
MPVSMNFRLVCAPFALGVLMAVRPAYAQDFLSPPHSSSLHFVQYGVALGAESLASAGGVCNDNATAPCILGPGLGMTIRMGYRSHGPLYIGGAYEATRHDSSNILRLAILQQLRAEIRYLFDQGTRLSPYALGGFGVSTYGNEWSVETVGPALHVGAGVWVSPGEDSLFALGPTAPVNDERTTSSASRYPNGFLLSLLSRSESRCPAGSTVGRKSPTTAYRR